MKTFLSVCAFAGGAAILAACSSETVSQGDDNFTENSDLPSCDDLTAKLCNPEGAQSNTGYEHVSGYSTGGVEYWPYAQPQPLYPDKIQWGYEAGSEAAQKCQGASLYRLTKYLASPPTELIKFSERTGVRGFYQWNNDMTGAAEGVRAMHPNLWLYENSLIKWISQTNRDGTCTLPTVDDLKRFANSN